MYKLETLFGARLATLVAQPPSTVSGVPEVKSRPEGEQGERYEEVRALAHRAAAKVSEAFDWRIRRRVALKRLREGA